MNSESIMRDMQRTINEATMEMDTDAYCWFMRELAEWCQTQADMQEYREEAVFDDDND